MGSVAMWRPKYPHVVRICLGSLGALLAVLTLASSGYAESKIGVILPMTGEFARYGERIREGLESEKLPSVRYVYEDEGCQARVAVSAFHKLHSFDRVRVFLGPWCGSPQVAVASLVSHIGGLAILGSSAPEKVYELSSGRMLAVQPSIEMESTFNAREAYRLGARRVVVVFSENDFSRAHEAAFRATFQGEILETLVYSTPDGSALRGIAAKIKQLGLDTLYIPDASPLMHGLIKNLRTVGVTRMRLMSVYSAQSDDVLTAVGAGGEGLLFSYPDIPGDALHYYPRLATEVLGYAVKQCPDQDPDCMKRAIGARYSFDEHGVLPGKVRLKTVRDGKFAWYEG